ncbi:MAG: TonB family protein [Thermodesulfovibrionales bacterium]|nr:TonB family protein [Thermodesulfovibrionales bacterium]
MPLIYRSIAFSALIHILFFISFILIGKYTNITKKTEPYIVSLIEESRIFQNQISQEPNQPKQNEATALEKKASSPPTPNLTKDTKSHEQIVKERIAMLEAKKRIEKIVTLRKVIDVGSKKNITQQGTQKTINSNSTKETSPISTNLNDYYNLIMNKIRQQWILPESLSVKSETIISIKIAKDGNVKIEKIEKSSGNNLFDRYAIRAINKANPLPPPPQEIEIGVRFNP